MGARLLMAGFMKSVLVHRHAFVPSPAQTMEIGRTAGLPASFEEAFGAEVPRDVDAAISSGRWPEAVRRLEAWAVREPRRPEPGAIRGLIRLWPAPGTGSRSDRFAARMDRYSAPAGLHALERAARDFPRWAPGRLWLALALLRRIELPSARRELDALIAARGDWAWPLLIRSELARVDIVYGDSLRDLRAAERLERDNAWIHAFRARVLFQRGGGPAALAAMDRAVALAPDAGWILAWRADSRRKLGDLAGADADLARALRLEPTYDRSYLWLGQVRLAQNRPLSAERILTRGLKACPHFDKAFAARARARFELGRVDEALRDLEAAVRINHRHNSFWNWTAEIEPLDEGRHRRLTALAGHARKFPRSARAWAWLGEAMTQAGQPDAGLAALSRALALSPRRPLLRCWRGEALLRLGRLPAAEREFDLAVRADPADGRARAFRGRARFLRGDHAAAVADLEKAVSDSMVEYSWAYFWRAEAKAAAGDAPGARADARTAVTLEPRRPEFRRLLRGLTRGEARA